MDRSLISKQNLSLSVYLLNATLLICHEIDSAYWQEWELFHIPGGSDLFVALHLILVALILWGVVLIVRDSSIARWFSLLLGLSGLAGGIIHSCFLIVGNQQFASTFSVSLIIAFTFTSCLQLIVTCFYWKKLYIKTNN